MRRSWRVYVWVCAGLLIAAAGPARAQSVGAVGGASVATVVFDDSFAKSTSFSPGATGGLMVSIGLPGRLGVSADGLFTLERTRLEGGPEDRFQYLDIPIQIRYRLTGGDRTHAVVVSAGAMFRRTIKATETSFGDTSDITDGVRDNDIALVAGVEVPLAPRWMLAARYVHGQNEIFRRANGAYSGRWRAVQVLARYAVWR